MRELRPFDRQIRQAPVAPDETKDSRDGVETTVARDREAQQRYRAERMRVRKAQRDAERLRLPDDEPVGEHALGRNLGGSLLAVRVQNRREEHRMRADERRMRLQPLALQVGKRRHEIESD